MPRVVAPALAACLWLAACGGGTVANEDLPLGAILVIAAILIVALLYAVYIGTRSK